MTKPHKSNKIAITDTYIHVIINGFPPLNLMVIILPSKAATIKIPEMTDSDAAILIIPSRINLLDAANPIKTVNAIVQTPAI